MNTDSTKKRGRTLVSGLVEQEYAKALVIVLVKQASLTNADDSQEKEVTAKWSGDSSELQVSGKTTLKNGQTGNGTTLKALLTLINNEYLEGVIIKKYSNNKKTLKELTDLQFKEKDRKVESQDYETERLRYGIQILKKLELLEETSQHKNSECRTFKFKFNSRDTEKIRNELKEKLEKNFPNKNTKISDKNNQIFIANRNDELLQELLSSLDCQAQKNQFKSIINDDDNKKVGCFLIQAEDNIQAWFIWSLTKFIGIFGNAKIIHTAIDIRVKANFNHLWQAIAESKNKNCSYEESINILNEKHQTRSIIILVKRFAELKDDNSIEMFSDFCSTLVSSLRNKEYNEESKYFLLFLLGKNEKFIKLEKKIYKNEPLILNSIGDWEIKEWLREKAEKFKNGEYNLNFGLEHYNKFPAENPHYVIQDICQGILDCEYPEVEHYWSAFK